MDACQCEGAHSVPRTHISVSVDVVFFLSGAKLNNFTFSHSYIRFADH